MQYPSLREQASADRLRCSESLGQAPCSAPYETQRQPLVRPRRTRYSGPPLPSPQRTSIRPCRLTSYKVRLDPVVAGRFASQRPGVSRVERGSSLANEHRPVVKISVCLLSQGARRPRSSMPQATSGQLVARGRRHWTDMNECTTRSGGADDTHPKYSRCFLHSLIVCDHPSKVPAEQLRRRQVNCIQRS